MSSVDMEIDLDDRYYVDLMLPKLNTISRPELLCLYKIVILCLSLIMLVSACANGPPHPSADYLSRAAQFGKSARQASRLRNYSAANDDLQTALLLLDDHPLEFTQTLRATLNCQLGEIRIEQGQWLKSESALLECLQLARSLKQHQLIARALASLGQNAFKQGEFEYANTYLQEAVTLATKNNDLPTLAFARLWLGAIAALRGNFGRAEVELLQAVAVAKEADDRATEGRARNILGENARLHGQYDDAINHYQEALTIYQSINNRFGMTMVIHNLGHVRTMMGDTGTALQYYDRSLRMAIDIHAIPAALEILAALAGIATDKDNFDQALELLGVVFAHPSSPKEALHLFAEPVLVRLQNKLPAEVIESGLARGRSLGFEKVIDALLIKHDKSE